MASEQKKIAYLEEHVSYELVMLNYTFMRLVASAPSTAEEQLDFNTYLESFGVHARNLVDFLSNRARGDECSAFDYVPGFEAPDQARVKPALLRLEKQIMHLTAIRSPDPQKKFDVDDARELYAWVVPAILGFQGALAPIYRVSLNALGPIDAR
jgi:hypothetical protein